MSFSLARHRCRAVMVVIVARLTGAMVRFCDFFGVELVGQVQDESDEAFRVGFFPHAWFGRDPAAGARGAVVAHGGQVRAPSPSNGYGTKRAPDLSRSERP